MAGDDDKGGQSIAAAAPRLPPLRSDLLEPWITRCVARFRTSGITSGITMVDYAIAVFPDDVMMRIQFGPVYESETPWNALVAALRSVLGEDPVASFSRIMKDDLDVTDPLVRHAELDRMLDPTKNTRSELMKWSLLRMIPEVDRESFLASHREKLTYEFAREASLFVSRRNASRSGYVNVSTSKAPLPKDPLCLLYTSDAADE